MIGKLSIKNIFIIYPLILKPILFIFVSTASFGVSTMEYFPVDKNQSSSNSFACPLGVINRVDIYFPITFFNLGSTMKFPIYNIRSGLYPFSTLVIKDLPGKRRRKHSYKYLKKRQNKKR